MIKEINADLFSLNADALAHGCNAMGIMNAGIALDFKAMYPKMYREYRQFCKSGLFEPGQIHYYVGSDNDPAIINLCTQLEPGSKANLDYIEECFKNILRDNQKWEGVKTLAMPRVGCGLGGLKWHDVKNLLHEYFENSDLEVLVARKN